MVKRQGGPRRKTRHLFRKKRSERGKISIRNYLQLFEKGDKVLLKLEPAIHKGPYFRRFHSKIGEIQKPRGSCYELSIKVGKQQKMLIVHPVHLRKCQK